jgi:hypothetical protein
MIFDGHRLLSMSGMAWLTNNIQSYYKGDKFQATL